MFGFGKKKEVHSEAVAAEALEQSVEASSSEMTRSPEEVAERARRDAEVVRMQQERWARASRPDQAKIDQVQKDLDSITEEAA